MQKNERDTCSTASDEETLGRQYYARHTISSGLAANLATATYRSRSTKYADWLSVAEINSARMALNSTCSQRAGASQATRVHGSNISATFASRMNRFRLDRGWMNIAIGPRNSEGSPTTAFVSSAARSDGSFDGLASWAGHSPALMFAISTPTLLSGVLKHGLGSPFATQ